MTYPEHEKMKLISDKSNAIGEFVDQFLPKKGIYLCESFEGGFDNGYRVNRTPIIKLLAEFFKIDLSKIEEEKQHMLNQHRLQNR